ncbi:MAG TPA: glycosyltransferase family 4 protein [Gemmatimonadales bacterium]|nr:glycosyltransferase family 4 protein [Gemmatimonadales bacterium]
MSSPTIMQVLHQGGGAGSVTSTLHLSLGLARAGWDVRFVCPPDSEVEAVARERGLAVRPLPLPPHSRRDNAAALARLIAVERAALVNSQSARDRAALTWLGMSGRLTIPFVATRRQMPRTTFLENWIASRVAARVVAVSSAVAEALVRRGTPRRKLTVIPNGLVTERVDRQVTSGEVEDWRARIGWDPGRRTLGIVSRRKDQAIVLGALAQVRTPVRLVLAGAGQEEALADAALRVPARHAVVLLPFVPDIRPLYELLDLVLLPSRMEGFSQALLEAMALGKPVIASAAAGNLDLVTEGTDGLLVAPTDPSAWAAAIERLLADQALAGRLGEAGRRTARETYALARTVERTGELYREVLRCPAPGARTDSSPA